MAIRMAWWVFAMVLAGAAPVLADVPPPVEAPTVVTGRVTDVLGRPVANARIYVLSRRGEPRDTRTNKDGRYSVRVATLGTHGVVIAIDKAHTYRSLLVTRGITNTLDVEVDLDIEGGEVIKIEDRKRPLPAVPPKPLGDPRQALPYSDEAVERDAWARAWLLLDVDETGTVVRLKMLKRPGFALERICLARAFELRFEPARDHQQRPMKTYVVWKMEWPSWGWLVQGNGTAVHRPSDSDDLHAYAQNVRKGVEGFERERGGMMRPIGGRGHVRSPRGPRSRTRSRASRAPARDRSTSIYETAPTATAPRPTCPRRTPCHGSRGTRPRPRSWSSPRRIC